MQRFSRVLINKLNAHITAHNVSIKFSENVTDINIFHSNYEIYEFEVLKLPIESS